MLTKLRKWTARIHSQTAILFGIIIGAAGTLWSIREISRDAARNAVLERAFIADLSTRIRPFAIIDSRGRFTSDAGGADQIDRFQCDFETNGFSMTLTIELRNHHDAPPVVRPLKGHFYLDSFERGPKHSWIYVFKPSMRSVVVEGFNGPLLTGGSGPIATNIASEFLVEILP